MVIEHIRIDFALNEGAVLRILGLIERRGFRVLKITMQQSGLDQPTSMMLAITPHDAARNLTVLLPQLGRLIDVRSCSRSPMPLASAA